MMQQAKDPASSLWWCGSLLGSVFVCQPGNFPMPWVWQKKKVSKFGGVFFVFCFAFYGHTRGIWKFPG